MGIDAARARHDAELMALPNVVGIGNGERDGKEVIKVFVSAKVPERSLRPQDRLPRTLDGYEVDVEEIGTVMAQDP